MFFFDKGKVFKMNVTCKEYDPCIRENCHFKISTWCTVKETGRMFLQEDNFQLSKPVLTVKVRYPLNVIKIQLNRC